MHLEFAQAKFLPHNYLCTAAHNGFMKRKMITTRFYLLLLLGLVDAAPTRRAGILSKRMIPYKPSTAGKVHQLSDSVVKNTDAKTPISSSGESCICITYHYR
jgi:hypothetical protein